MSDKCLTDEIKELRHINKLLCDEWAMIDSHINAICLHHGIDELDVYGGDYGVPDVIDKINLLAECLRKERTGDDKNSET